jgi:hypothetical protein
MNPTAKNMPMLPRAVVARLRSCTTLIKILKNNLVKDEPKKKNLIQAKPCTQGGARL